MKCIGCACDLPASSCCPHEVTGVSKPFTFGLPTSFSSYGRASEPGCHTSLRQAARAARARFAARSCIASDSKSDLRQTHGLQDLLHNPLTPPKSLVVPDDDDAPILGAIPRGHPNLPTSSNCKLRRPCTRFLRRSSGYGCRSCPVRSPRTCRAPPGGSRRLRFTCLFGPSCMSSAWTSTTGCTSFNWSATSTVKGVHKPGEATPAIRLQRLADPGLHQRQAWAKDRASRMEKGNLRHSNGARCRWIWPKP